MHTRRRCSPTQCANWWWKRESFGWHRFIGLDGDSVTMNRFGASAPGGTCLKEFGFTVENVIKKAKALLA